MVVACPRFFPDFDIAVKCDRRSLPGNGSVLGVGVPMLKSGLRTGIGEGSTTGRYLVPARAARRPRGSSADG